MAIRPRRVVRIVLPILAALTASALAQGMASAHEPRQVGELKVVVGWLEEPPLAGFKNAVEFTATRGGAPVGGGRLRVVILFGDKDSETQSEPLALQPFPGAPGRYIAVLIPTRPGAYTFHVTGRISGEKIDEFFTSGPRTFDEVRNPTEAEFPAQDPTTAELADRLERLDARIGQTLAEVQALEAQSGTDTPTLILAGGAALLGAIALALALLRRPARGS